MPPATDIPASSSAAATARNASPVSQTTIFSCLLHSLYAATFDDSQWQTFLTQLCEATASMSGFYMRNDAVLGTQILACGGDALPVRAMREYRESRRLTDPFREAYMLRPRPGVIEGEELVPHSRWVTSELYQKDGSQRGWEHMTCMVISLTPRSQQLLSLWRGAGRMYLEPQQREILDLLLPHLENAVRIRQILGRAETRASNAEAALSASTTATFLLDASGRIVHMNDAAEQMALEEDGFRIHISRFVPSNPAQRAVFQTLVAAAADADQRRPGGALQLNRRRGKPPLNLLVTPLRLPQAHRASVRVLLLLSDPAQPVAFPDAVLRSLYQLTPAETEIANGLLTGLSLQEIASLRGVAIATVRSQLKSLLARTGTRTQADLLRLLATLPRSTPSA